jgi:hypothetical protein
MDISKSPPKARGPQVDAEVLAAGPPKLVRQRVQVGGAALAEIARVKNAAPVPADYGLVTRPLLYDANGNAIVQKAIPAGGAGQLAIPVWTNAIQNASYVIGAAPVSGALTAATRKDVLSLWHAAAATKTVKIRGILVGGYQTTALAGTVNVNLYRGTAAPVGGAAVTPAPTNPATAGAEVSCVTVPTSITAATLLIATTPATLPATANTGWASVWLYQWTDSSDMQPFTLRAGSLDALSLAVQSTAAQNLTLSVCILLTEE